jgi:hypothetical protein
MTASDRCSGHARGTALAAVRFRPTHYESPAGRPPVSLIVIGLSLVYLLRFSSASCRNQGPQHPDRARPLR